MFSLLPLEASPGTDNTEVATKAHAALATDEAMSNPLCITSCPPLLSAHLLLSGVRCARCRVWNPSHVRHVPATQ